MLSAIVFNNALIPAHSHPNEQLTDPMTVIFCLSSKAEAVDLTETIRQLKGRASILAFGTAKDHLRNEFADRMITIEGTEEINSCQAEKSVDPLLVEKIVNVLAKYAIFVTGYGSEAQIDILQKLYPRHATTCVGYYDPFQAIEEHRYASRLWQTSNFSVDALMVTCKSLKCEANRKFPDLLIETVGKHDLDVWSSYPKEKDFSALIDAQLSWGPDNLTVLYAGCHGVNYREDFRLFLESIKECQKYSEKHISIWIALHPDIKCDGEIEIEEIKKLDLQNVTMAKKGVPTLRLLPFANLFISATSGTVINAAAFGLPSFYTCEKYNNYLIEKGMAQKASNQSEFIELFKNSMCIKKVSLRDEIPENASKNITEFIQEIIEMQETKSKAS